MTHATRTVTATANTMAATTHGGHLLGGSTGLGGLAALLPQPGGFEGLELGAINAKPPQPSDLRVVEREDRLVVVPDTGLKRSLHDLDVLLRHRPRSISRRGGRVRQRELLGVGRPG